MNNEEKILQVLTQMQGDISDLKQGQAKLEQGQAKLKQDVEETKRIVLVIEQEHGESIAALHDGYSALYDISNEIRDDIKELKAASEKNDVSIAVMKHGRNLK